MLEELSRSCSVHRRWITCLPRHPSDMSKGIVKAFRKVKRAQEIQAATAEVTQKKAKPEEVKELWLSGVTAHIIQAGIGKTRTEIFQKQIAQNGGKVSLAFSPAVTHVIVDDAMGCDRALRLLKLQRLPPNVQLVHSAWLSLCISERRLLSTAGHSIYIPDSCLQPEQRICAHKSGNESQQGNPYPEDNRQSVLSSHAGLNSPKPEENIIEPPPDTTAETFHISADKEACQIHGISKRMAEKIWEILETGHLRKLDYICESVSVLEAFANIWGAGMKTAQIWYHQGFRNLEDIKTKASLNRQQAIGLKHYHDFLDRMSREEAAEIERTVCDAARSVNPGLTGLACGSYRRGKSTCGDVDVLITHPDGKSHRGVLSKILNNLKEKGFITDDLVSQEENRNQVKYLGVCLLPGPHHRYRRLDIIVVPNAEFACALLYFTGSAHLNRSMRALAKAKQMSLSEHSLNCQVLRKGNIKVSKGIAIPTPTERTIFEKLGLMYREPHERDW
ncbi:DNA polymerase lambda isoform X4 [Narcine bancroftii]|uniref:DNA polymerase lambda isoform X4 n=1 Tax=Narcine bancroftii TaxID=1343680 RepID=UPI0038317E3E